LKLEAGLPVEALDELLTACQEEDVEEDDLDTELEESEEENGN
jgi:hypothetical protein